MPLKLNNGLNFVITNDILYQKKMQNKICEENDVLIYVNNITFSANELRKKIFWVNEHENSFFKKRRKFKNVIDINSEIVTSLDIQPKVFDLQLRRLWHWSYLCSCAIGISKGKQIFIFPWIRGKECAIQSYRFQKLYEYSIANNLTVLIPTDDLSQLENDKQKTLKYNVIM